MASTLTPITLKGTVNAISTLSTYDVSDGTGMELAGRTFSIEITNIFQQGIFDDSTRQESQYNGIDVSPGYYICDTSGDIIYRIVRISAKTNTSVSCTVEDIEMLSYRITGVNEMGTEQPAVIFAANSENEPMISVNQFSDGTVWATDALNKISTRFKLTEYDDRAKFTHSSAPSISLGDVVTVDSSGNLVKMHDAGANAIPVGTVFEILRGGLDIYVKPFNDIINQYKNPEELDGSVGDTYYTDSTDLGKVTTVQDGPAVYLQLSEAQATVVTGTDSSLPGASDVFIINGTTVFDGPSGDSVVDMNALVNLINGFTVDTNVSASQISEIASTTTGDVTPTFQGNSAFADDVVIPVQQTGQTNSNPPQLEISDGANSVTVTFNNPNTTGGPFDIYDSAAIFTAIDTALTGSSVQITATQTTISAGSGISLTANNLNVSIVLTSLVNDFLGNNLINDLGLNATSNPIGPSLVLTRSSGGVIEIQGTPVQGGYINSNGIVSSGLGKPPRLLLLELGEGDQLYISEVDDAVAMVEDHGGLDAGTTSGAIGNGQFTVSQILDQILFPGICPTTTDPSVDIVVPQGLILVGTVSNVVLSFSADQGDVISATGSVSNYAGDVISATIGGSGIPVMTNLTFTPPTTIANYTVSNYEYLYGNQNNWKLYVVFADGPALVDNLGESCEGAWTQALLEDTGIVEGVYHVYSGNSTLYNTGTSDTVWDNATYWDAMSLFSFQNNTYFDLVQDYDETAVGTTGGWTRHRFAVPDVLTLDDVQIYNTSSATYMSVNYANMFTTFNVTLDVLGNTVNYTIYEKSDSPGGGASYRIYFTAQ